MADSTVLLLVDLKGCCLEWLWAPHLGLWWVVMMGRCWVLKSVAYSVGHSAVWRENYLGRCLVDQRDGMTVGHLVRSMVSQMAKRKARMKAVQREWQLVVQMDNKRELMSAVWLVGLKVYDLEILKVAR